jgi:uncharacterized phage protein (TIGR02216 family)
MSEPTQWMALYAQSHVRSPEAFWRLSLKEWRAIAGQPEAAALDRNAFDVLAARFPDEERT